MRILVAVKRVVDYNARIRVKADKTGVELSNVKMSMNPFCEIAVEEALRLREKNVAKEVIAVSLGPQQSQDTLRTALAMGADKAIHVVTDKELQPLAVAKVLAALARKEQPGIFMLGKQAIDDAATKRARCSLGSSAGRSDVRFQSGGGGGQAGGAHYQGAGWGLQTLGLTLPAVITADLRLNEPRYATLPNIMKAKKKPIQQLKPEDLGVDIEPRLATVEVVEPAKRKGGVIVSSVAELVDKLRNEAKVL